jgi:uncharacterized protein (DUF952 family)
VLIYKIFLPSQWNEFESAGHFAGSPFDHASGFIHCSSRAQLTSTARRFFADERALVIAALDTRQLGESVRWEESAGGEPFPHVYDRLPLSAVAAVYQVAGAAAVERALQQT